MGILFVAAASAALVAQGDEANFRYVDCMFEVARSTDAGTDPQELSRILQRSCQDERVKYRRLAMEIQRQRGVPIKTAVSNWQQLEEDGIASIVNARGLAEKLAQK